ncbi:hypothetical protein C8R46DRAFT_1218380 [Mycena filopes]|nr:hypothetical protein C8R46DRAFT_1218380 [Mycena filopes]
MDNVEKLPQEPQVQMDNNHQTTTRTGGFFPDCHDFVLSGGNFTSITNIANAAATPPLDFRSIPLGDIDLHYEIRLHSHFGIQSRHTRGCARRLYSARIQGLPEKTTVAIYQGRQAETAWRDDILRYSSLRHPNFMQLFGTEHEFFDVAHYLHDLFKCSPYMVKLWIRPSSGRLCVDITTDRHRDLTVLNLLRWDTPQSRLLAPDQVLEIVASMPLVKYHHLCWIHLSQTLIFPVLTQMTVALGAINYVSPQPQRHAPIEIASLQDLPLADAGWYIPTQAAVTLENGWTRVSSVAIGHGDVFTLSISLEHPQLYESWLAQANHIFKFLNIESEYENYFLVTEVEFRFAISAQPRGPGYLFLCPVSTVQWGNPTHVRCPEILFYWSVEPTGEKRLEPHDARSLGFHCSEMSVEVTGHSWPASVYKGLCEFHHGKGFDAYGRDVARVLGLPFYHAARKYEPSFTSAQSPPKLEDFPPLKANIPSSKNRQNSAPPIVETAKTERGIPTSPLSKGSKKKKPFRPVDATPNTAQKTWWQQWEDSGELSVVRGGYDKLTPRAERLRRALAEFIKHHKLNGYKPLQALWDSFRTFVGANLPTNVIAFRSADSSSSKSNGVDIKTSPNTNDSMNAFLDAPAQSIAIFLSSYMHTRGHMWDPHKLVSAPHLLRFFVKYLLRNQVLPECADGLEEALETIECAGEELPLVPRISNALPDAFGTACRLRWRRRGDGYVGEDVVGVGVVVVAEDVVGAPGDGVVAEIDAVKVKRKKGKRARKAKRIAHGERSDEVIEEIETEGVAALRNGGVDEPASGGWGVGVGWGVTVDTGDCATVPATGGWGTGGGWGDTDVKSQTNDGGAVSGWGTVPESPAPSIPPDLPPPATLASLLGPTALPVTHAPGIVEQSSPRRIKTILPPTSHTNTNTNLPDEGMGGAAYAVECVLEARFHRVVLVPWPDANATAEPPRIIFPASCGAHPKAHGHDLAKDEIVVLMDAEAAGLLRAGMGLVGTWVQLARVQDEEYSEVEVLLGILTKKQKARRRLRYWYLDELLMILPSYWST